MLERLWFSLCAVVAVLVFAFGAVINVAVIGDAVLGDRRIQWDALATGVALTTIGPLACRFIYRWGLWVVRGSG